MNGATYTKIKEILHYRHENVYGNLAIATKMSKDSKAI